MIELKFLHGFTQGILFTVAYLAYRDCQCNWPAEKHLHLDFFDLTTGLAGAIYQKFLNNYVKAAIVADLDRIEITKFKQLIFKCIKGNQ